MLLPCVLVVDVKPLTDALFFGRCYCQVADGKATAGWLCVGRCYCQLDPSAQDQFMDAVQGPTNQVQGPAVQNQAQGPANNKAQVGQNVPVQPPQQLAPAQLVPTGLVLPASQVFYQN